MFARCMTLDSKLRGEHHKAMTTQQTTNDELIVQQCHPSQRLLPVSGPDGAGVRQGVPRLEPLA